MSGFCELRSLFEETDMSTTEYQNRPFAVEWYDSHFSGTFRFNTLAEAVQEMCDRYTRGVAYARRNRYSATYMRRCFLITPTGRIRGDFVVLANDASSY